MRLFQSAKRLLDSTQPEAESTSLIFYDIKRRNINHYFERLSGTIGRPHINIAEITLSSLCAMSDIHIEST